MGTLDLVAILTLVAIVAGVALVARWNWQRKHPTKWTIKGTPPHGLREALAVISRFTPGMPQAGTIEWVEGYFVVKEINKPAAGVMYGVEPIHIKLTYFERIEQTALAHECDHAWRVITTGESIEPSESPMVANYIAAVNSEIAKALGR
jgi:hypothetical protein